MEVPNDIVSEIVHCFGLLNEGKEEAIKEHFDNEPYYRNFVGLAKRIAPDGRRVNLVGFTIVNKDGKAEEVGLRRTQKSIEPVADTASADSQLGNATNVNGPQTIHIRGKLLFADATKTKQKIQLVEQDETKHNIEVPEGMMSDIVRPLWEDMVDVTGIRLKKRIRLLEITRVEFPEGE